MPCQYNQSHVITSLHKAILANLYLSISYTYFMIGKDSIVENFSQNKLSYFKIDISITEKKKLIFKTTFYSSINQ